MRPTIQRVVVNAVSGEMPVLRDGHYVAEQWHLRLTCLVEPGEKPSWDHPGSPAEVEVVDVLLRPESDPEWRQLDDQHAYVAWISPDDVWDLVLEQLAERSLP